MAKFDPTKLAPLLECAICLRPYDNPLVLPCLHSFCRHCLKTHVSATKNEAGSFECPSCRNKCTVPKDGIDKFPRNFFANSLKDTVSSILNEMELVEERKRVPHCDHHSEQKIDCYCKTCAVPVCPYCFIESHKAHEMEKMSVIAESAKKDLDGVRMLAAQRIASLKKIAEALDSEKIQMEKDLDQVKQSISDAEDSMHCLIRQHATTLKNRVEKAKKTSQKVFAEAQAKVQCLQENTVEVKGRVESLCQEANTLPFCTVTQSPSFRQQVKDQQAVPIPMVRWTLMKAQCKLGSVKSPTCLGRVGEVEKKIATAKLGWDTSDNGGKIGTPIKVTKLEYLGSMGVCGIAVIYQTLQCVAHYGDKYLWVYNQDDQPGRKVSIPKVEEIWGLRAVGGNQGKLAVVDGKEEKVHIVTLSSNLEVLHYSFINTQFVPNRLSGSKELFVFNSKAKKVSVFTVDGLFVRDISLDIQADDINLLCVLKSTPQTYVVCNQANAVYLVDATGAVLRTSDVCKKPWSAACTSWGHVLVADSKDHQVRVFNEAGDFLGNLMDTESDMKYPYYLSLNEGDETLHVGCGGVGDMKVYTYKFSLSALPPLALKLSEEKLQVSVDLAKV